MGLQPGRATNDPSNYFAFGLQANKNTDASTFFFTKHMDGTGFEADNEVESIKEGGDGQQVGLRYRTMVKADGNLVTLSRNSVAARLWHGVLGSESIASAGVPSLAQHTAAPAASLPYFTIEQRQSDLIERTSNNVITSLSEEGEAGKPWRLTAAFMSGGTYTVRDVASTLTPARESGRPAFFPGGSYRFDGQASYGADVTKWKLEVTRGVDDGIQTTGLNRDDVIALDLAVAVDATLKYTSRDFYKSVQFTGGSVPISALATGSLDLVAYSQVSTMAASALSRRVVPLLEWTDAKINRLDPDGKTVYLDVVGADIKHATHAVFALNDNTDTTTYTGT
jgi:hypothetical protein